MTSSSEGGFYGLLRSAGLNVGEGEVHCQELHLLILYQQTERRLGQLCGSGGVFFQPLFLLRSCLAVPNVCVCVCSSQHLVDGSVKQGQPAGGFVHTVLFLLLFLLFSVLYLLQHSLCIWSASSWIHNVHACLSCVNRVCVCVCVCA